MGGLPTLGGKRKRKGAKPMVLRGKRKVDDASTVHTLFIPAQTPSLSAWSLIMLIIPDSQDVRKCPNS